MPTFTNTVEIERSARDVFAFLANLENVPAWNDAITRTRKTSSGDIGIGTTFEQSRRSPTPGRETIEIVEFEPDRHLTLEGTLASFPARLEYVVEDLDGKAEVTNTVELELTGAAKILRGLASGRIRSAVAHNLQVLKRLLETPPRV